MANIFQIRKEQFQLKESPSEPQFSSHAFIIGRHNKPHLVRDADHFEIEIKEEPIFCETPVSDIGLDNETASVDSNSESFKYNVPESEFELPSEVEIKEEPWWLVRTSEVNCDKDNSSVDGFEHEIKVEMNGFVRREKSPDSNETQPHLHPPTPLTASVKRQRNRNVGKREQGTVAKSLCMMSKVEGKDEWNLFGQFVARELRSLQRAPKLQIKLKNLIQNSIIEIRSEYAQNIYMPQHVLYCNK